MHQGAPELLGQLNLEGRVAERCRLAELDLVVQVRPAGQVEGDIHERLVERQRDRREAADPRLGAERLGESLSEDDAGVLDGVVGVDLEVSPRLDLEVHATVLAELGQHVVEERQARVHQGSARPVELEEDRHLGLVGRTSPLRRRGSGSGSHRHP